MGCIGFMYALTLLLSNYDLSFFLGNDSTCQMQGFFRHISFLIGLGLDLFLSVTYMLMIKCQWQEDRLDKLEKWVHLSL